MHKSISEWLRGQALDSEQPLEAEAGNKSPWWGTPSSAGARPAVDVPAGERAWAEHCARLALGQRDLSTTPELYCLRYTLQHHASAGLWGGLRAALLDFDYWTHAFRAGGLEFLLVQDVAAAERAAAAAAAAVTGEAAQEAAAAAAVCSDILRWLLTGGRLMRGDPERAVLQSAACSTPASSAVFKAAQAFHRSSSFSQLSAPAAWGPELFNVTIGGWLRSACFAPSAAMVLVSGRNASRILDADTGELITELSGHEGDVSSVAWVGGVIATACEVRCDCSLPPSCVSKCLG